MRTLTDDSPLLSSVSKPMTFRPRQTSYLRIAPKMVLQLILYLEPADVDWMSSEILGRVFAALKDRIPKKLSTEQVDWLKGSGKSKVKVDVYRGGQSLIPARLGEVLMRWEGVADFQFAYFFRKTGSQHAVLLKDKTIYDPRASNRPAQARRGGNNDALDLTQDDRGVGPVPREMRGDMGEFTVKDEEEDVLLPPRGMQVDHEQEEEEEDVKLDDYEDQKPQLKVKYTGFAIFSHSLVVVIEPYPRRSAKDRAHVPSVPGEIHQLSASAPPESFRHPSHRPASRSGTGTPAPPRARRPLFRRATSPLEEEEEEDDNMRGLRESSQLLANASSDEDEEDLPSAHDVIAGRHLSKYG